MLVELSMVEQRYLAVREVLDGGAKITDIATRYRVDRRTLHRWLLRYANQGLSALADRSSKPDRCPHQIAPEIEARIVSLRRAHPGWGPRTILNKLRRDLEEPPSRSSIYRCLVRHRLVDPAWPGEARAHRTRAGPGGRGTPRSCSPRLQRRSRCGTASSTRQLAEDIAVEARLARYLTDEIAALDERIALQFAEADPEGILTSAPAIGAITGAQILGRLGDPNRFRSLAGVRSFSGLVPSLDASGVSGRHGGPTRAGDAALREAIFIAADHARRVDPTLAARYYRLMVTAGKHHNSALCHVATTLLTRIVACWRRGERYVIRDGDGRPVSVAEGRRIVTERYTIPAELRRTGAPAAGATVDGRAGAVRSRSALRRRARPTITLQPRRSLDSR
jgi:transposase-like protein